MRDKIDEFCALNGIQCPNAHKLDHFISIPQFRSTNMLTCCRSMLSAHLLLESTSKSYIFDLMISLAPLCEYFNIKYPQMILVLMRLSNLRSRSIFGLYTCSFRFICQFLFNSLSLVECYCGVIDLKSPSEYFILN